MSMIGKILDWFGADGLAHVLVSLVLCALLAAFMPVWIAALAAFAAGIAKELVYDLWMKRGTCDLKDVVCDMAGTLLGIAVALLQCL